LPIQAFGAMPDRPVTGGWSRAPVEIVPALPAAIPATWVPWKLARGSSARRPRRPEPGPGNVRATITLGLVHRLAPFGKPAGYCRPAAAKNGFAGSTPSSTTAILTPVPRAPVAAVYWAAAMTAALRFSATL
jgi:hypothetical protein